MESVGGLALTVTTATVCLVEQTVERPPLLPLSHDPEDHEDLTPIYNLLVRRVVAQPLLFDAHRCIEYRQTYKAAQNFTYKI